MTIESATAFRSALLGLKVMHDAGWLHRDLKPSNIGLISKPLCSVLLDIDTSRHLQAGRMLRSEPGTCGTLGYVAPELEVDNYDHSIDIWSMGVVLFELTYGYHPWKYAFNPWRHGNEGLRPFFQKSYQDAIDKMDSDYRTARVSPAKDYIHRQCSMSTSCGR
jgi:serine/threonine protein kinase